jgi:hypothetical protein
MKRYNQGFGFFGPMEQASDGKWCLYEDWNALLKEERRDTEFFANKVKTLRAELLDRRKAIVVLKSNFSTMTAVAVVSILFNVIYALKILEII